MVVLDTNLISILEWDSPAAESLRAALRLAGAEEIGTTIVCFEEQMRGWMSYLASKPLMVDQISGYERLRRQLRNYCMANILPFDDKAAVQFQQLRKLKPRGSRMDLKIAAIALVNDCTLWTENDKHFEGIPGLKLRPWERKSIP